MRPVSFITPDLYPWLIGGLAVFLVLFVVLTFRIVKNRHLRRESSTPLPPIPQQRTSQPVQFGTAVPPMAAAVRNSVSTSERNSVLWLITAMAGYGPSLEDESVRYGAVEVMKQSAYGSFLRAFREATGIPEHIMFDKRPIDEVTGNPLEKLIDDDKLLALMVAYALPIQQFYTRHDQHPRIIHQFPSIVTMTSTLDKLARIHREFYAG